MEPGNDSFGQVSGYPSIALPQTLLLLCFHPCRASNPTLSWLLIFVYLSGDKTLDGYQKKKYVCKLLFIFLLGHDIDFGHMEAVNLLSSNKYTEKQIVSAEQVVRFIIASNNR